MTAGESEFASRSLAGYWDSVAAAWRLARRQRLWRECSDRQQIELLMRWWKGCDRGRAHQDFLKTDLFDEVAGRGIVPWLIARGARVTGIDVAPSIVAEAVARNEDLEAYDADVRSLPFADASFDVVFSGSTLDHFDTVADIRRAIGELSRMLRPGGMLILTLDNPTNPVIRLRNGPMLHLLRRVGIVPYQVGATFGHRALSEAVTAAGLQVVETTAVMHCPRVIAVALAGFLQHVGRSWQEAFMGGLASWEFLERLPTRWLTGHYVAICAVKPQA